MGTKPATGRLKAALLIAGALSLGACSTSGSQIREIVGLENTTPDEFLIVTKAPLVMPPDIRLRAPAPGAPQINQLSPTEVARAGILGETKKVSGTQSSAESALLARTGSGNANVRQAMRRENRAIIETSESLTDQIFRTRRDKAEVLNADAEAQRLLLLKRSGKGRLTASDILQSGSTATN